MQEICRSQLSDLTPVQSTIFLPFSAAGPVGGGEERVAAACRHCAERESRRAVAALHGGGRTAELRSGRVRYAVWLMAACTQKDWSFIYPISSLTLAEQLKHGD